MTTDEILDALRYKSEGTDLDFKQAQYRFVKATANDKAEFLKDIVAIANAWRDGTGYILVGFKDSSPPSGRNRWNNGASGRCEHPAVRKQQGEAETGLPI